MACAIPIRAQLDGLKTLAPGWHDGSGESYDRAALDRLARLMEERMDALGLPTPHLYPTPDGFVRAEWSSAAWEVVATIDLARASADIVVACVGTDEHYELALGPVWAQAD